MRWICPQCGSEVSLALDACPRCAQAAPPSTTEKSIPAADRDHATPPSASAPSESLYRRGLRFGVGFMLAVVTIVLLVVLLLLWLSGHPEWQW